MYKSLNHYVLKTFVVYCNACNAYGLSESTPRGGVNKCSANLMANDAEFKN